MTKPIKPGQHRIDLRDEKALSDAFATQLEQVVENWVAKHGGDKVAIKMAHYAVTLLLVKATIILIEICETRHMEKADIDALVDGYCDATEKCLRRYRKKEKQ